MVFANFSFTNLWLSGAERITPIMWRVDETSGEIPYLPEKWLEEWLAARGQSAPIYAFAKTGVRPLSASYVWIMDRHQIDQVLLVDGGADSVIFGDEVGVGSAVEDAVSILAVDKVAGSKAILAAIGFGVDHYQRRFAPCISSERRQPDAGRRISRGVFASPGHAGSHPLSRSCRLCQSTAAAA